MVAIPKFWYNLTQNGRSLKIQIANEAVAGFSVSPAHMDRGDGKGERDIVYIGRYHCADDFKSKGGVLPQRGITRAAARTGIHSLGANIWQFDFAILFTVWLLYLVEFADWNSQAMIGYGCGNVGNGTSVVATGTSDTMPYHSGTMQSSRTAYGVGVQYRNIEGLWDNLSDFCDGCYYNDNGLNLINKPSSFSDSSGGTLAGKPANTSSSASHYPSKFSVSSSAKFPMFYPTETTGDSSTYSCDTWVFQGASFPVIVGGGNIALRNTNSGLFSIGVLGSSTLPGNIGCRLMELP